jgi:hypothetical protein
MVQPSVLEVSSAGLIPFQALVSIQVTLGTIAPTLMYYTTVKMVAVIAQ